MNVARRSAVLLGVAALAFVPAAAAKEFRPGDLRVCNAKRCVAIANQAVLDGLSSFYYGSRSPAIVPSPRMGAPYFQLRFTNGYVTGIVGTAKLDRFLSYGVHIDHFRRGRWHRVPAAAALELRQLTEGLRPLRLTRTAVLKSR